MASRTVASNSSYTAMRLRAESRSDSSDAARLVSSVTLSESAPMMSPDAPRRCGSSDTRSPSLPGPTPRVRAKSVYERGKERQNSRITRPKVLLIVGHPSVGSALETLLHIDDRYEVRRVQSLADSAIDRNEWTPDVAVVDGALLGSTIVAALPVPAIVLSGNEADGTRLLARVPDGRTWLRKDATATDLRDAVDGVLAGRPIAGRLFPLVVAALVLVVVIAIFAAALLRGQG